MKAISRWYAPVLGALPWLVASLALASEIRRPDEERVSAIIVDASRQRITDRQRHSASFALISGTSTQQCRAEISIRGSSSAKREKKPYRFELQDENGDDLKVSLLGMPKESDWILYPAYTDKTMIRDVLAYELWRQMGYWAPRTRYVHLFIFTNSVPSASSVLNTNFAAFRVRPRPDGSGFRGQSPGYQGVYVLMEKIKRGKHRLNIEKLPRSSSASSADSCSNDVVSGGYIFKKDRHNNTNEIHFRTTKKVDLLIEEPKSHDITPEQNAYLTNHINEFEAVLFSDYFADPVIGYKRYVDIDSFIDYHWMQELAKNADGYWWSEFYHKDRGGKIKIGPIWDCDLYFGNTWYNDGHKTNEWRWERSANIHYRWYKRMFKDPDFLQRYIDRWSELRTNVLSTSNIFAIIDRHAAELSEAQKLNYERWPTIGKKIGPVYFVGESYEQEVQWLKDWLEARLAWIDSQDFPKPVLTVTHPLLSTPPVEALAKSGSLPSRSSVKNSASETSAFSLQPSALSISCQVGSIFYTTNNTDPRLPGGHVSTNALAYKSPIPITPSLTVRARVLSEYGLWSAPAIYP